MPVEGQSGRSFVLPPATSDGRAASSVGMNWTSSSKAVVSVVRPSRSRRTGDSVRRQCTVGDVVSPPFPVQRPSIWYTDVVVFLLPRIVKAFYVECVDVRGRPFESVAKKNQGWVFRERFRSREWNEEKRDNDKEEEVKSKRRSFHGNAGEESE